MKYTLLFISILFILSSCGERGGQWGSHAIPEGGFTIEMPSPMEKLEKKEETAFGSKVKHYVRWKPSSLAMDKFKLFEVSYIDIPPSIASDSMLLNETLDKAAELRKNDFSEVDFIESQVIEFNGYPGRAFFYDAPKGNTMVSVKMCIVNNRLYDLIVIAKKNYSVNAEMSNFFNSFKVDQ